MLANDLRSKIDKLWDRMWSGGIANPLTVIEQVSYLLFMKRLEDLDNQSKKRADARKEKHESIFKDHEDCRWSHWRHYNADDMMKHIRDTVFPFIKTLKAGEDGEFARLMSDAAFLIPKPSLVQEAVSIIDELNISGQNQDVQGDLYEYLLSELSQAGKAGQFRTPRHIIRMMVQLTDPKINDRICDPACGTAGFLVNAYQHILEENTSKELIKYDDQGFPHNLIGDKIVDKRAWEKLRKHTFWGYDFDATMVRIGAMNMILHGVEHPNIERRDALSKMFVQKPQFDLILANPPFTGSIDESDINDAFKVKTTKTELLFVELFHNMLEIGGRAAVIVPTGVLFGSSSAHQRVRELLVEKNQLEAVITMPSGIFRPYAGVATAILVFTKGGDTTKVWFYEMASDGFTLDDKRTRIDGKGDLPDIIAKYKTKAESEKSFCVDVEEIVHNKYNLSPSQYKEVKHDEVHHEDPAAIIDRVLKTEAEITKELNELKRMVR